MTKMGKRELLEAICARYLRAGKAEIDGLVHGPGQGAGWRHDGGALHTRGCRPTTRCSGSI